MFELMTKKFPEMNVQMWVINANTQGCAQDRKRVFWIGMHKDILAYAGMDQLRFPPECEDVPLHDLLDTHKKMPDIRLTRTRKQQHNILYYDNVLKQDYMAHDNYVQCAVCDHSRDPDRKFKEFFSVEELRASMGY